MNRVMAAAFAASLLGSPALAQEAQGEGDGARPPSAREALQNRLQDRVQGRAQPPAQAQEPRPQPQAQPQQAQPQQPARPQPPRAERPAGEPAGRPAVRVPDPRVVEAPPSSAAEATRSGIRQRILRSAPQTTDRADDRPRGGVSRPAPAATTADVAPGPTTATEEPPRSVREALADSLRRRTGVLPAQFQPPPVTERPPDMRPDGRRGRDRDRRRWDNRYWRHEYDCPRVYGYAYYAPVGFFNHYWTFGDYMPWGWYSSRYWINDYWRYGLPMPPAGAEWVRVGRDIVLVDIFTGRVLAVARSVFW